MGPEVGITIWISVSALLPIHCSFLGKPFKLPEHHFLFVKCRNSFQGPVTFFCDQIKNYFFELCDVGVCVVDNND